MKAWRTVRCRALSCLCVVAVWHAAAQSSTASLALVPPRGPAMMPSAYFGIHVHNSGAQRHWPDIPVGSIRLWDADVTWSTLEQVPGTWDFARLDEYIAWARGRGIEVVLTLGLAPRWASARPAEPGAYGLGSAAEPADLDRWRGYVRRVATRYRGRIAAYEVCNEANLPAFFSGTAEMLVRMTQIAREEVLRADPAALLVGPSGTGLDAGRVGWMGRLLALGLRDVIDIAAFHLYRNSGPPEAMIQPVGALLAAKAAAGSSSMPIWNTESGYAMPNPRARWQDAELRDVIPAQLAAEYLPRDLLLARALGFERYHWYDWDGNKMGLLDPETGGHRPVADVYAQFIRAFSGATLHRCDRGAAGLWTCALRLADGAAAFAYWVDPEAFGQRQLPPPLPDARYLILNGHSAWLPMPAALAVGPVVTLVTGAK